MNGRAECRYGMAELLRVMQRLRDPRGGCPWDLAQDFDTIAPSTLEEAYELVAAIEQGDFPHVAEELGDLLFQVIFYAQLGSERELFDFDRIVDILAQKLIRRHPHVFAGGELEGVVEQDTAVEAVGHIWEAVKREERLAKKQGSALADVPTSLPALSRAQKLQKRAANVGFDWADIDGVLAKLREESAEFAEAVGQGERRREEELGDILFTCVNLARHAGIDAETALRRAGNRFERRFRRMEARANEAGKGLEELGGESLESLWEDAKRGI